MRVEVRADGSSMACKGSGFNGSPAALLGRDDVTQDHGASSGMRIGLQPATSVPRAAGGCIGYARYGAIDGIARAEVGR
jgi:hypothetical protein